MKKYCIHFLEMLLGITSLSAGAAMGIIAGLGQTTSTGTCSAISGALGIKVGTAMIILYGFFQVLAPESYPERFVVFAVGMVLISLGFTCVKCSRFVNYPPETFCSMMAERTGIRFGTSKIVLDFVYVGTSLLLCRFCGLDFGIVREGTLIFAVMNGILINLFMPWVERAFAKAEGVVL